MHREYWIRGERAVFNFDYAPYLDLHGLPPATAYYNGWRPGDRCLSITVRVWRWIGNLAVFFQQG